MTSSSNSKMRGDLNEDELAAVAEGSLRYTGDFGLDNARANQPMITHSIDELRGEVLPGHFGESALIITAGPSLHKQNPAKLIEEMGYHGPIIAVDAALSYCLRNSLVPDYVISVDPHHEFILRWFGDPDLGSRTKHEYYDYLARQELDPEFAEDHVARNARHMELVNRYGPEMKMVIATSVAPNVARRCLDAGMSLYWWNPLYDDWDAPNSYTRRAWEMNKLPCMVGGGNVATSAWVFAYSILGKKRIGLVGMDFSYAPGTSLRNTQRYPEMCDFFGEEDAAKGYIQIHNPYLNETWFTDPTYAWYRRSFLDMATQADCETYNCTEGGIIFGDNIKWTSLEEFLWASATI